MDDNYSNPTGITLIDLSIERVTVTSNAVTLVL